MITQRRAAPRRSWIRTDTPHRGTSSGRRPFPDRGSRSCLLLCVLSALLLAPIGRTTAAAEFQGLVVGVTDGDTIKVLHDSRAEVVRLNGIDAPEKGQAFGDKAKRYTADLVAGRAVTVVVRDRDRYGRTVADVVLPDGRSLNQVIVRGGYAWWFRRYSADPRLALAEAAARSERVGLWVDAHPVPPWEWRRSRHSAAATSTATSRTTGRRSRPARAG